MSRALAVLLAVGAGCLVGMQAPINSRLGRTIGSVQAATVSFMVGTLALILAVTVVNGGLSGTSPTSGAPPGGRCSAGCSARST